MNFHFESKEKLFVETLQFMSDEYAAHWRAALRRANPAPAARLRALILADLDEAICNPRMTSAWVAFWAEAATRPAYQALCWSHDEDYVSVVCDLCEGLKAEAGYTFDAQRIATAVYALQEGLWLRLMFGDEGLSRVKALAVALACLGSLFPKHFDQYGTEKQ